MRPPGLTDSPLATLRAALDLAMEFKPPQFEAEFTSLERETGKLRGWLGVHGITKPPQDASRAALRDFVRDRDLPTLKHATLASFGCTDPFDHLRYGLIAEKELFPVFLDRVDDYRGNPRALRLCYRGLLHAYFQYDVEREGPPAARDNWGRLRAYLGDRTRLIASPGFQPSWVGALQGNLEVLGSDPGAFYGAEIFRGRREKFEQVRAELPVTDASWLVWRVIVGQIEAATQAPDAEFGAAISNLLDLLGKHPSAKTFGLSKLLFRYRQCTNPTMHEGLRDFAVEAWGNPWLALNEAAWSVVAPDARMMVSEWLKLALMQKFFGLLAEDGQNDTRRLRFWETYRHSIHAMYFALGDTARTDHRRDFREVRKQMEGLQLRLTHSTSKNNAFIMCIGDHVIVEFGEKGNACFIFKRNEIPFKFEGEVAGNSLALKGTRGRVERLTHMDGSELWEDKFRRILANIVHVKSPPPPPRAPAMTSGSRVLRYGQSLPSSEASGKQAAQTGQAGGWQAEPSTSQILREPDTSIQLPPSATFTMAEFTRFCELRKLNTADFREKGGNLWVYHKNPNSHEASKLSAWGFRFKANLGWWFQ